MAGITRRLIRRTLWSGLAVVVTAVLAAAGLLTFTAGSGSAEDPPTDLSNAFHDSRQGSTLRIQLDTTASNFGAFTLALPGNGLVWPDTLGSAKVVTSAAQLASSAAGSKANGFQLNCPGTTSQLPFVKGHKVFWLSYDGTGSIDAGAQLDTEFGVNNVATGSAAAVSSLHLCGVADATSGYALVGVAVDKVIKLIAAVPLALPPASVVQQYLTAVTKSDWATLYTISDTSLRKSLTQSDFVAAMKADGTTVSQAQVTGPTSTLTTTAGVTYARTPIRTTSAGTSTDGTLVLILDSGAWKVLTVE
jgi:hypothetical protein